MSDSQPDNPSASQLPRVKKISEPTSVPVFNCPVLVGKTADSEQYVARCATLDVEGRGKSERDAIQDAVAAFKVRVARHMAVEEEIPWIDPPKSAAKYEKEFYIPVHL